MTKPTFSPTGHNPACETLAAEMRSTLKEIIALWPRATDMRAVASKALEKVTMPKNLQDQFDQEIASLISKYRAPRRNLSMAKIIESLENAKRAAEESGEK